MTSPFTTGNFTGWGGSGLVTYSLGRGYADSVDLSGESILLSPALTASFAEGDLFTADCEAGGAGKLITLECLSSEMTVLASNSTNLAAYDAGVLSVPMPAATARVRMIFSGLDYGYIYALEVPGLDVSPQSGLPSTNSIPSGWVAEAGGFAFSYSAGVDSGDGSGSIVAISPTGGEAAIRTHTFDSLDSSVFYSIRCSIDAAASYSGVNCHYEAFDASDMQLGGGNIPDPVTGGAWVTGGFLLPPETSYLKIFVHGAPDQAFYLDGIHLPAAPAPATTSAYVVAPMALVAIEASEPGAVLSALAPRPIIRAHFGAHAAVGAPRASASAYTGAHLAIAAPSPLVTITAHDSTGENAITVRVPSPTLSFYTGAAAKAKAPSPTLSITGTVTGWAKVSIQSPNPKVIATATVSGMMSSAIRAPSPNLVGYGGAVCSVTLTGSPTVVSSATTGGIVGAQITCPLFQVTASATAQNRASVNVIAPSPRMGTTMQAWVMAPMAKVTCIGSATITATYEAYAINLNHIPVRGVDPVDEVTRYTNFPFTHVVRYKNNYYGANSTGLYLLEGTTDNGTPIPWAFETAITDFKSPNKKTLAAAYFSGRFGTSSTIQLKKGEKSPVTHAFTTPRGTLAQNHRQVFGKDRAETRTRYFALAASGTGELELDAIECDVHNSTRRI